MARKVYFGDPGDPRKWVACASKIAERLADGRYPSGALLPVTAKIGADVGESHGLVSRALRGLRDAGVIVPGEKGRYRAGNSTDGYSQEPPQHLPALNQGAQDRQTRNHQDSRDEFLSHEEYLTADELAIFLRISKMSVYRAINTGEIEGVVRIGKKHFRIPVSSSREYLKKQLVSPGQVDIEDLSDGD